MEEKVLRQVTLYVFGSIIPFLNILLYNLYTSSPVQIQWEANVLGTETPARLLTSDGTTLSRL